LRRTLVRSYRYSTKNFG